MKKTVTPYDTLEQLKQLGFPVTSTPAMMLSKGFTVIVVTGPNPVARNQCRYTIERNLTSRHIKFLVNKNGNLQTELGGELFIIEPTKDISAWDRESRDKTYVAVFRGR